MGKEEKGFQSYFLSKSGHSYRSDTNVGEPDTQVVRGLATYRVELKIFKVGVSGNKKISGVFKPGQIPWYMQFLKDNGKGLYVIFRLNKGYGIIEVDKQFCRDIKKLTYKDLIELENYREYKYLSDLLENTFI